MLDATRGCSAEERWRAGIDMNKTDGFDVSEGRVFLGKVSVVRLTIISFLSTGTYFPILQCGSQRSGTVPWL